MKNKKVPITKRALIQRISRALAKQDECLSYSRRQKSYMVIDCVGNFLVEHVDLHEKAQELGVLQPWEVYAEEDMSQTLQTKYPSGPQKHIRNDIERRLANYANESRISSRAI